MQPDLVFDRSEFAQRLERTKSAMEQHGLELLVVTDPANMDWLTGYDNWSFYYTQAVIVSLEAPEPLLVVRNTELGSALWTVYMDRSNIVIWPDAYIVDPDLHPARFLGETIAERFGDAQTIGVELDVNCYTPRAHAELQQALPAVEFVSADLLVNWLRTVKSPAEVALMREAAAISDSAMLAVTDAIEVGVRECDAAAALHHALIRGTDEFGGEFPIRPSMPNGERTNGAHLSFTDKPYRADTSTNIELGGSRHKYHAGLSRTVYLGDPPDRLKRLAEVTHGGFDIALAEVRAGATCDHAASAWSTHIAKHGFEKASRIGYAIGLGYPPAAWLEQTASLAVGDANVMATNMTFHMILGMWLDNWGYVFSETFVVTDHGYETLANFPRELIIK